MRPSPYTESSELVEDSLTRRAAREVCRKVGQDGSSVAQMAREFGVGWECAMNCVRRHGEPLVDDPVRLDDVAALGIDEHKMLSANGEHHTEYVTCFVDVIRGRLLDIVRGRNANDVAFWLSQAPGSWLQDIEAVAIDPHRGYLKGILSYLPDTVVTVDCFHGVKLANSMVDDIRRRVQQESTGHRGRKQDPLFCTRRDDSFKPRGGGNTSSPGVGHSRGHFARGFSFLVKDRGWAVSGSREP